MASKKLSLKAINPGVSTIFSRLISGDENRSKVTKAIKDPFENPATELAQYISSGAKGRDKPIASAKLRGKKLIQSRLDLQPNFSACFLKEEKK